MGGHKPRYIPGDFWRVCDRSGFEIRRSEARREWNGLLVRDKDWEPRHPQDFVRGVPDHQNVSDPRPRPADRRAGTLTTFIFEDYNIGDTAISVGSILNINSGDTVKIVLDTGEVQQTTVATEGGGTATGGYHLTLANALRGNTTHRNALQDTSKVTTTTDGY